MLAYTHRLDVRFVREPDIASWLIGLKETSAHGRKFTHVGAVTDPDEDGTRYEFGARLRANGSLTGKPGVQERPLDYAEFEYRETVSIPCTAWEHEHFWLAMDRVRGERYSRRSILGIVTGFNFHDEYGFICDALVEWGLYKADMLPRELIAQERGMDVQDAYYLCLGIRDGRLAAAS